ncbi:unnamed protein product [Paramecium sonneborni]|uniref:Uncharacterized protein n=1 Tax=Paramecium sonneborni TaxID=65129 RepID=A0A8S1MH34_9CILI|nr:unnamed protein product [Paramecium sonneborni]
MKGVVEQSKLSIRIDSVKVPSYLKLIEETEQIHSNILKTLQIIQIKDIQDLFYILKPTQQLYNCVCGLLCFVAGVDKSITTDYLFLQQRDWVVSQSQFCKNYESINQILCNLQQNLIKKKINISNIKEAQKYYTEDSKYQINTIADKLERILTFSINYYISFYKIIKLNQKYEQQLKTPQEKSQDELKSYMLSKVSNNLLDDDSEGKFEEETQIQNEKVQQNSSTPKDQGIPFLMLSRFKDFSSYQKGVSDHQKIAKSPKLPNYSSSSKKYYQKSKSPLQSSNKQKQVNNFMNEYMSFQNQVSVKDFQTQPQELLNSQRNNQIISNIKNVRQKSSQSKSPVIAICQNNAIKKKKIIQDLPNLNQIVEKIQKKDPNIEKQLVEELEIVQKEIKKLESKKKQLEWQDERQSKKIREFYEQQYQSEKIEQSKKFLENKQQFKEEQKQKLKNENKKHIKHIKIKNEVQDFQQQRNWSLYKELERSIMHKETLQKDAQWMEQYVCIKNQGIQKY